MKDNYFTPEADLLEYDFKDSLSASHDASPASTPTPNEKKKCDIPATKNYKCVGGIKNKKC